MRLRWKRWKVALVAFVGALVLAAAAGALYERHAVRRDAQRFPPPGDPGPRTITAGLMAEDLRRLLDSARIDQPIVIVASSIGGVTAEYFARRHPERVAGLVFLDAGNGEAVARISESNIPFLVNLGCGTAITAGSVGFLRLIHPWDLRREKTVQSERSAALMYGAKPWVVLCGIVRVNEWEMEGCSWKRPPDRRQSTAGGRG